MSYDADIMINPVKTEIPVFYDQAIARTDCLVVSYNAVAVLRMRASIQ